MRLHKKIERNNEEKQRLRQRLAPYISEGKEKRRTAVSVRTTSAIACMLAVIITLSVVLPVTLINSPGEPQISDPGTSAPPGEEPPRYSYTGKDFKGVELGYYINPLYVGEEDANASNFGVCLEEYCEENDLNILYIPRNTISEFYADEHIAWRNTYMNIHKEVPAVRYWQENILSPETPDDTLRSGQTSVTLTVMTKEVDINSYQINDKYASYAIINDIHIAYLFSGNFISTNEYAFSEVSIAFEYGDYKYFILIEPKDPFLIIENGEQIIPPDISVAQIYIEDILSTAK